eukprot:CAMPEP_0169119030 /NCGR_PEP_ID=MMETSP1015-20121227/31326_1 /TAXON_ID=342587 /ORGANISM="Karlodinium micrum, Strain CCMP2283" /LENGTH=329 /DNA_ID=CAMNT_0009181857 /DNA_START=75 /DNA_END=1064 /DNA_ORIENTATION=+
MCAMIVDCAEDFLRVVCTRCHAPLALGEPSTGLCHSCASEAMVSSVTSDEVRQLTWVEVHDLGLQDLAVRPEEQVAHHEDSRNLHSPSWSPALVAIASPSWSHALAVAADPELWELLPEAADPSASSLTDLRSATGFATSTTSEDPELWSVFPAEVLASAERRRSESANESGESVGVQHVIAGSIIEEYREASDISATVMEPVALLELPSASDSPFEWSELTSDVRQVLPQNSSPEEVFRYEAPLQGDVEVAANEKALAASASSSQVHHGQALCIVCVKAVADATFVHGLTGHTACCLPCAQEVQRRCQSCPVCRLPFTAVIRNFVTTT